MLSCLQARQIRDWMHRKVAPPKDFVLGVIEEARGYGVVLTPVPRADAMSGWREGVVMSPIGLVTVRRANSLSRSSGGSVCHVVELLPQSMRGITGVVVCTRYEGDVRRYVLLASDVARLAKPEHALQIRIAPEEVRKSGKARIDWGRHLRAYGLLRK